MWSEIGMGEDEDEEEEERGENSEEEKEGQARKLMDGLIDMGEAGADWGNLTKTSLGR